MSDQNDAQDLDTQLLKQMLQDFLEEALELLDQLNLHLIQLEEEPENDELINQIFRIAHTIKGSAGFAGLDEMSKTLICNINLSKFRLINIFDFFQ